MTQDSNPESTPPGPRRVIKRYSNRKLYDTKGSTYVTLLQIAEMIREGEEVEIIDNATKEDKTDVTLALIISEELRSKPRAIPLSTLKALVRHGGERLLNQLRTGPIGKLIPTPPPDEEGSAAQLPEEDLTQSKDTKPGFRATLAEWQTAIDERIRTVLPNFAAFHELGQEVARLSARLDALEKKLGAQGPETPSGAPPNNPNGTADRG
ncbi:MAG TPA: polyhydroxyalkanoate synthesis regulator DNA-binding domain-containing protein [Polyangiaceae bacterium]|nr:polyhydroxyalkanoate synthesis regulator DNA-binding domain-containing protein [Polyangiaceae bacterium]